jgi:Mg2+/Co2+ transporter CorB
MTLLFILIFLILLSAFFSGAEIGMMSFNRYRLKYLVKKGHRGAIRVEKLLSRPERLLSVVLIGNTLANVFSSSIATLMGQTLYGEMGVAVFTAILTLIILVFSELLPKTFAAIFPEKVAILVALPLTFMQWLFLPLIKLITWITNGILKLFGIHLDKIQAEALTNDELRSVLHESHVLLPFEHKSMLLSLLDLDNATIEDIMIPKLEIVGIDIDESWSNILEQLEMTQHTRLPLYKKTIDNLVGLIHLKAILNLVLDDNLTLETLLEASEAPYYVPEGTHLNEQMLHFRRLKKRSCFVVDEYGELLGLATLEDILEEVVGEFTTDSSHMNKDLVILDEHSYIIDASITIRQFHRLTGWQLPELGPKTLSGIIVEYLGYIPPAMCCLQLDKFYIEILKVSDNMIKSIRLTNPTQSS